MKDNLKQKGQGLVEYALILVLVAIVVIVVLAVLNKPATTITTTGATPIPTRLCAASSPKQIAPPRRGYLFA